MTFFLRSLLIGSCVINAFGDDVAVKVQPINVGAFTEYGKVVKGSKFESYGSDGDITNSNLSRTAAWLAQSITVNERFQISGGISGLFWYALPEQEGLPHTRLLKFATGVPIAAGTYSFGDLEQPFLQLQMGFFPYKTNPDSKNLGEYLFRSGTYPGYLWTGGWTYLNTSVYSANGIRGAFSFLDNKLKFDANLLIERDIEPNLDISPSMVLTYSQGSLFEVGGGAVFSHYLPSNSKKVTPKVRANAYANQEYTDKNGVKKFRVLPLPQSEFNKPGLSYFGPGNPKNDPMVVEATDPKYGTTLAPTDPRYVEGQPNKYISPEENGIPNNQLNYYTYKGIKLMAKASFNPLSLLESEYLEAGAGKIYAEVAVLGVKDYPFYYEKIQERMPVMIGMNIPTFKLLDYLSIEGEYYKNRFPNSIKTSFSDVNPVWDLPIDSKRKITTPSPGDFLDSAMQAKNQDLFWSINAKKTVIPGFAIYAQASSDHTRALNPYANPGYQPFTKTYKEWYWAIRAEFSI